MPAPGKAPVSRIYLIQKASLVFPPLWLCPAGKGYTLHTASGESSTHLHNYLEGMGIRACFGTLYSPDLLGTLKERPAYYERLFADSGIAPSDALIGDASPRALAWAKEFGAMTVLIGSNHETLDGMLRIGSLAELPELVRQIAS